MSTIRLDYEFKDKPILDGFRRLRRAAGNARAAFMDIGEGFLLNIEDRFSKEMDPDGRPWAKLSPRTLRRKKNNKILTESSQLRGSYTYIAGSDQLIVGTNIHYAAIHQFGGTIEIAARSQQAYFKRNNTGEVGNRFVGKRRSNFSQWVTIGAHKIEMPARPVLGIGALDRNLIVAKLADHYRRAVQG